MRNLCRTLAPLLLLASTTVWSADGRILSLEGDVRVNGQRVNEGAILNEDDSIMTAPGASARILLADNSVLDLEGGTQLELSEYAYNPDEPEENSSEFGIVEGGLRYVSGLIAKDDPEDVRFNAGDSTIGVRGSYTGIRLAGASVDVEAMIGEAVVTLSDDECPGKTYIVTTGSVAQTGATDCEVVIGRSTRRDEVNEVVYAIASADPDDAVAAAAIAGKLGSLSTADLAMVIAVLNNNASQLGIDYSRVVDAVGAIAAVNPAAAGNVVFIASLLNPDISNDAVNRAIEKAPEQADNVNRARQQAREAGQGLNRPADNDSETPGQAELRGTPATIRYINSDVAPGGGIPADPSPE